MKLVVARIGAPHGLKGEVSLFIRTDDPTHRLREGAVFETSSQETLTLSRVRRYKDRYYAIFHECSSRTQAEVLRGIDLLVDTNSELEREEDAFYLHELKGLEVLDTQGYTLGHVIDVEYMPTQELLVVKEPDGKIARVPFVHELVVEVDIDDHCLVVDPPVGLFSDAPLYED
ncbi:MAG: ribosome maturation factor RimM [Actinomycetaceae bacterium]|nr:ribosome maturation factor RimM [Actinomycetaceae bacterium]